MRSDSSTRFSKSWNSALQETPPDPQGAAGELMHLFADILDVELVEYDRIGSAALFLMDLGSLGFRGMDLNVVMVTHPPVDEADADLQQQLLGDYRSAVKSIGYCFHVILTDNPPEEIADGFPDIVVLTHADLDRLAQSPVPGSVLFSALRRQVQVHRLCPFNTTHEAHGGMFRGRRDEIESLVEGGDTNYLVTGARMIGKTSLLKRARSVLMRNRAIRDRVFYFDCSVWGGQWDCLLRLIHAVDVSEERRLEQNYSLRQASYILKRRSMNGRKQLILFLDETDGLVDRESTTGWPFFSFLHEATENRWVRVAFAGYRSVTELLHGLQSPFHNRLEALQLGELSPGEAEGLLLDPMKIADIAVREPGELVRRVYAASAGQPFLVQFYGERLYRAGVKREPMEIMPSDVDAVEASDELSRFHKKHFLMSTELRGRPVADERLCALVLAHAVDAEDGWATQTFETTCRELGRPLTMDRADAALTHLCDARVFTTVGRRYRFTFPLLRRILRADYPDLKTAALES